MGKRFTDTEKWEDSWFRNLLVDYQKFWIFILDKCDAAGVWEVDFEVAEFFLKQTINPEEYLKVFESRIIVFDGGKRWFIPKFIKFQYGVLDPACRPHKSVLNLLSTYKIEGYLKGIYTLKDKDKNNTIQEKDKNKEKEKNKENIRPVVRTVSDLVIPIQYLNEKTKRNFSVSCKATLRLIQARFAEGRSLEDFKKVIDKKCSKWLTDEKMADFLRPETLFNATKFESYLNENGAEPMREIDKYGNKNRP